MIDDLDPAPADPTPDPAPDPSPDTQPDPNPDPSPDPDPAPAADWRVELAGEDEKLGKFLGKFPDLKALASDAKSNRDKLMQRAAAKLPENPTDEELAAYRAEHGIPDKPDGYLDQLPSGLVVGDDDRPAVDAFLAEMHAINAPKPAVDAALSAYYKIAEEQQAVEVDRIAEAKEASINTLRDEWGADYKRNVNATDAYLSTLPPEVAEAFDGVAPDGIPLKNNAAVIQWLAGIALEANPLNTVVPGHGSNQASAVADEIAAIEKRMREDRPGYNKDEKMQERYRELITAQQKLKGE
jgi:hypothetical protein